MALSPGPVTSRKWGMGYAVRVDGVKRSVPCVKLGVCLRRRTKDAKIFKSFVLIHEGRTKSPAFLFF